MFIATGCLNLTDTAAYATCFRNMQIVILCKLHCIFCMLVIWTKQKDRGNTSCHKSRAIHTSSIDIPFVSWCCSMFIFFIIIIFFFTSVRTWLVAFSSAASNPTVFAMAAASYVAVLVALAAAALAVLLRNAVFWAEDKTAARKSWVFLRSVLKIAMYHPNHFHVACMNLNLMIPSLDGGDQSF